MYLKVLDRTPWLHKTRVFRVQKPDNKQDCSKKNTPRKNTSTVVMFQPATVAACLQMLQPYEADTVCVSNYSQVLMNSNSLNSFKLYSTDTHGSVLFACSVTTQGFDLTEHAYSCRSNVPNNMLKCLHEVARQILPLHCQCEKTSEQIQMSLANTGATSLHNILLSHPNIMPFTRHGVPDSFIQDNATTISHLTDICNSSKSGIFSYKHTSKMVQLAGLFCSTAPAGPSTCFDVSALQAYSLDADLIDMFYAQPPCKHSLTVLTKGSSRDCRIQRTNCAVRFFAKNHAFTKKLQVTHLNMNETIDSDLLAVSGPSNNQLALLYVGSASKSSRDLHAIQQSFYG
jgi:hypothetical protein